MTKEPQQPPARPKAQASKEPKENVFRNAWVESVKYLKGVRAEFGRVTWPTSKELRYNTIVVIVLVSLISTYMWGVDRILTWIFSHVHQA